MEVLHILEEKIARLIESKKQDLEIIAALKSELSGLKQEHEALAIEARKMEATLLAQNESNADLDKERKSTKSAVDELISSIDALIDTEAQA